jgi:hypothetical protein
MRTGPPARGDQLPGNGELRYAGGTGHPGDDPLEAQRERLVGFWATVLRRFRDYAHRSTAANRDRRKEGR